MGPACILNVSADLAPSTAMTWPETNRAAGPPGYRAAGPPGRRAAGPPGRTGREPSRRHPIRDRGGRADWWAWTAHFPARPRRIASGLRWRAWNPGR